MLRAPTTSLDDLAPFVVDSAPVGPDASAAPAALAQSDDIWWLSLPPADEIDVLIDDAANSDSDPFYSDEPWATVYAGLAGGNARLDVDRCGRPRWGGGLRVHRLGGIQFGGAGATTFFCQLRSRWCRRLAVRWRRNVVLLGELHPRVAQVDWQFAGVATAAFTSAFAPQLALAGCSSEAPRQRVSIPASALRASGGIQFGGSASAVEVNFYVFSASGGLLRRIRGRIVGASGSGNDPDPNSVGPRVALTSLRRSHDPSSTPTARPTPHAAAMAPCCSSSRCLARTGTAPSPMLGDIVNII